MVLPSFTVFCFLFVFFRRGMGTREITRCHKKKDERLKKTRKCLNCRLAFPFFFVCVGAGGVARWFLLCVADVWESWAEIGTRRPISSSSLRREKRPTNGGGEWRFSFLYFCLFFGPSFVAAVPNRFSRVTLLFFRARWWLHWRWVFVGPWRLIRSPRPIFIFETFFFHRIRLGLLFRQIS